MDISIDELKRRVDRAGLISLAASEQLATAPGRVQCPHRCSDDKRGASVSENGIWHCKHCDRGGSAVDLLIATRGLDLQSACELLAERLGALPPPRAPRTPPNAAVLWRALATTDQTGEEYLRGRGLHPAVGLGVVRFNVGTAAAAGPGGAWLDSQSQRGYRVAVPLFSQQGELASLQLRAVVPTADPRFSKLSLAGVTYPQGGVAFGSVGQARTASRVYLSEGMADTLALLTAGVVAVGAPGVDQVKRLGAFIGNPEARTIILCAQNDLARVAAGAKTRLTSESAFRELEQDLAAAGAHVLWLSTPPPHKDPADWLRAVGVDTFRSELERLQPAEEYDAGPAPSTSSGQLALVHSLNPDQDPRPQIRIRVEQHEVVAEAISALALDPQVFQRDGALVHVARDRSSTTHAGVTRAAAAPHIVPLPRPVLGTRLAAQARWVKTLKSKGGRRVPDHPPDWAVNAVHAYGTWPGVRWLSGIVEMPILRADGTVLETPGYDAATGLLFEPAGEFLPSPASPTLADARAALDELLEVVEDFPFAARAHRSAWLAALFTPLARHAFEGPAPLFLFDSNTRGSGKSKLADLVALINSGREMPRMAPEDRPEEWRKRITSIAMSGDPMVLIDNVVGSLGNPALDGALTGSASYDRVMGGNTMATSPLRAVWFATGNNVQLRGDLFRRALHARLESAHERPEERADFHRPNLLAWVSKERPRLHRAALTILRGFCAAGRPADLTPWGSFEGWSALVRGAIVWVGFPDPYATRAALSEQADSEASLLAQLLSAWEELFADHAFTIAQVLRGFDAEERLARSKNDVPKQPRLYDVFQELAAPQGGKFSSLKLSGRFRAFRKRIVNGKYFDCVTNRDDVSEWRVVGAEAVRGLRGYAGVVNAAPGVISKTTPQTKFTLSTMQQTPATPATPAANQPESLDQGSFGDE